MDCTFEYPGRPAPAEKWSAVGVIKNIGGMDWDIYRHGEDSPKGWQNVKVSARGAHPHKANYWLAWNGERFAQSRDCVTAETHSPDLLKAVSIFLTNGERTCPTPTHTGGGR